jgi:hypothetical protein
LPAEPWPVVGEPEPLPPAWVPIVFEAWIVPGDCEGKLGTLEDPSADVWILPPPGLETCALFVPEFPPRLENDCVATEFPPDIEPCEVVSKRVELPPRFENDCGTLFAAELPPRFDDDCVTLFPAEFPPPIETCPEDIEREAVLTVVPAPEIGVSLDAEDWEAPILATELPLGAVVFPFVAGCEAPLLAAELALEIGDCPDAEG